ncbi:DUF4386 domain-containing protein [Oceanobacillus saliphilus]|uniref:DUF4386 domain-containing protein n=1 Tax=Oceanobacillus saliphilus TaxID=2925834 RepID=UPI00201DD7DC|nr:DUF4386 domain-containing protein [Oceanobacillus saliphilus]
MANSVKQLSEQRKSALTAGIFLIIMALAAGFSYGFVHGSLVVPDDANTTLKNIMESNLLFYAGIFGWLLILITDIVVAWAFYIFLKPINKNISLLAAWFRLIYAAILGIAIMNLIFVVLLINRANDGTSFNTEELQAWVMLFLEAFHITWAVGLIIFGVHLLIVGYLAFKSDTIPKFISILLLIAAVSYMIIHLCYTFLPQYDGLTSLLESVLRVPMTLGELGFGLWLLFKGGKVQTKAQAPV